MDFRRVEQTLMLSFTPDADVKRRRLTIVIAQTRAKGISKIRTQLKRIRVVRDFFSLRKHKGRSSLQQSDLSPTHRE